MPCRAPKEERIRTLEDGDELLNGRSEGLKEWRGEDEDEERGQQLEENSKCPKT